MKRFAEQVLATVKEIWAKPRARRTIGVVTLAGALTGGAVFWGRSPI